MPSINLRELRDTRKLKAWLRAGKTVELRERQTVIARIEPVAKKAGEIAEMPDWEGRRRRIFGDKPPFPTSAVLDMRREEEY